MARGGGVVWEESGTCKGDLEEGPWPVSGPLQRELEETSLSGLLVCECPEPSGSWVAVLGGRGRGQRQGNLPGTGPLCPAHSVAGRGWIQGQTL